MHVLLLFDSLFFGEFCVCGKAVLVVFGYFMLSDPA